MLYYIFTMAHCAKRNSSNIEAVRALFLWWSVVECGGVWWSVVEGGCVMTSLINIRHNYMQ